VQIKRKEFRNFCDRKPANAEKRGLAGKGVSFSGSWVTSYAWMADGQLAKPACIAREALLMLPQSGTDAKYPSAGIGAFRDLRGLIASVPQVGHTVDRRRFERSGRGPGE
jgi:hypothetical protein